MHRFYQEQYQLDGGRQDRYVTGSDAVGLTMGHYDTKKLPIYEYLHSRKAPDYAISDRFFQAAFGGSFLNHQWLVAAATPTFPGAPTDGSANDLHSLVDSNGMPNTYPLYTPTGAVKDAALTIPCDSANADGLACGDYAVNTIQPPYQPYSPGTAVEKRLPPQILAPKSVSAVWALGSPELRQRIEAAHEIAIDRALTYAVQHVPMLRQRIDASTVLHAKAIASRRDELAAHHRSRCGRSGPGPAAALAYPAARRAPPRWTARGDRFADVDATSARGRRGVPERARSRARHDRIRGRAPGTGRGERYFDQLAGVPQPLLDRWSSRHHQVQAAIRERLSATERDLRAVIAEGGPAAADAHERLELLLANGQPAPAEERLMGTITRAGKVAVSAADLDTEWRRTARAIGFTAERVDVLRRQQHQPLTPAAPDRVLDALTEFDATFPAREARAVALERSAGAAINDALRPLVELRDGGEILRLADGSGTTRAHRAREHETIRTAERVIDHRITALDRDSVVAQADRLDRELRGRGARLSDEQRQAIMLGCSDRQLVMIEGQAGTGKSTALTGIARAHHNAGREIVVTSTAAVAAERLARDLHYAGVDTRHYSLAALQTAITNGTVALGPQTTIIHDEAALASTREQHALLAAVETSGARLIAVGDPRQNPSVGAGGLWPDIEAATLDQHSQAVLTHNLRARDPADRRDQARFRDGHHELAVRGYAARDRVHTSAGLTRAEDAALEAAHTDTRSGRTTIVLAQTSNDHLDELNARYQAIRLQHGELGATAIPAPGRPYDLHRGDEVQIRRTINHPVHGPLRNGTTALIRDIAPDARTIGLALPTGHPVTLSIEQADAAQLRLAYVQHPFPAQGITTGTAHLIVSAHTTREGTYVALTRARQETHLYAEQSVDPGGTATASKPSPSGSAGPSPTSRRSASRSSTTGRPPRQPPAASRSSPTSRPDSRRAAITWESMSGPRPTRRSRSTGRLNVTSDRRWPGPSPHSTLGSTRVLPAVAIKAHPTGDGHVDLGSSRPATYANLSATTRRPPGHRAGNRDEPEGARSAPWRGVPTYDALLPRRRRDGSVLPSSDEEINRQRLSP